MQVDSGKAPITNVVQVEDGKDKVQDAQKGPMIIEKSVDASQKLVLANDHEASSTTLTTRIRRSFFSLGGARPG